MLRVHVQFVTVAMAAALLWIAGCASEPRLEEVLQPPVTVALLPVDNRSGVDLQRQPGLVWQSSEIMRLLLTMESNEAPLAVWPFSETEPGELPAEVSADSALRSQLSFEPQEGILRWRETMLFEEHQRLRGLSDDVAWQEAVETLYAQSQRDRHDVLAMFTTALEVELGRRGFEVSRLEAEQVPRRLPYAERMAVAHETSGASHALLVAVERWDASDVFESGEVVVAARAALVDAQTRELRWHRKVESLRLHVGNPEENANSRVHGVLDMRPVYPRLATTLAAHLLSGE